MARRRGRKGDHLATDEYTGFTVFASQLSRDYWGAYSRKPLLRNLQEIASPLNDPTPVDIYLGSNYEISDGTEDDVPIHVGLTTANTSVQNAAIQTPGLYANVANGKIILGIGSMTIGSTFVVT